MMIGCSSIKDHAKLTCTNIEILWLQDASASCGATTSEEEGECDDDAGAEAEDEECSSSDGGSLAPCDIGLLERLIRSHPVWFLAGLQRAGAVHLLQGKEEGVSNISVANIVRVSNVELNLKIVGRDWSLI